MQPARSGYECTLDMGSPTRGETPLKITFAMYRPGLAGGTRITSRYAEVLARRGHQVSVVCLGPRRSRPRAFVEKLLRITPRLSERDRSPFLQRAGVPVKVVPGETPRVSDFPDADAVIATFWPTAHWVVDLPTRKGAKFYFIQHHEKHAYHDAAQVDATYRMPLSKITISNWLRDIMASEYGDEDVPVIHNPVDLDQFFADERAKQDVPTLGFMYSPRPFKAVGVALEAVELVRKALPNVRVLSFGPTAATAALPLPPYVEYVERPPQDSIRTYYSSCDVWLCSSSVEGFALPPLEAMACRTPVVSTRVGAMPELIEDGKNGYLVDVGDAKAMAERAVALLTASAEDWRKLSAAAHATATRTTWDSATAAFEVELRRRLSAHR